MNIKEWLDTEPLEEEIRIKDGGKYIPYHIIVEKLDKLCVMGIGSWSTRNFSHLFYTLKNGKTIVSGSIDLVIKLDPIKYPSLRLAGAATFAMSKSSNPHPAASVKSLAVMNAVKPLGKQFGWGLNGFENESVYFPEEEVPDVLSDIEKATKEFEEKAKKCMTIEELTAFRPLQPYQQPIYAKELKRLTNNITKP